MRLILLPFVAFMLVAASPRTQEAGRLLDAGQDASAFRPVEQAAGEGDLDAVEYLAWFYDSGRYVRQDKVEAVRQYRRAATGGHANAQWRLGVMLDMGEGVAEDPDQALTWIRRAAAQDHAEGNASLAVMYANGRGTPVDYAASMRHYRRAAQLGASAGFYGIGVLHALGQGVPTDRIEAAGWFIVATMLRDSRSEPAMNRLNLSRAELGRATTRARAILREFGRDEELREEIEDEPVPVV
ncbi:MAG TPA: tetratricopeptide repeat protein [Allosphingosinicella sp.]|nr:tetratricopeptide repeat protein [Allosphingosinicella sp.]